ncbi:MAG: type II toxin-antitoxin system VapC family toxin [Thermoleophilia bacterium]|nr:type II toxin-antitoxin system VapC family toxin [Thermoleophilia bacterium]
MYGDSSALVKLVVDEPESVALEAYVHGRRAALVTSRIALVEVPRAVTIANPEARDEAWRLLESCLLVDVGDRLLRRAAAVASPPVRTLDAIHLATAERVEADEVVTYDRRLAVAAAERGFAVASPSH